MSHHHEPEYRFCPVCGGKLEKKLLKASEPDRLVCTECQFVFYQDPKVVACAVVEINGKILLLRRAINPQKGKWVIPGGYVDRGEVVERAAIREVKEECGVEVKISGLLGVYSYEERAVVVVVYIAKALSGKPGPGDETLEARTFLVDEIPWKELAFQSTVDALKDYCDIKGKGPLKRNEERGNESRTSNH